MTDPTSTGPDADEDAIDLPTFIPTPQADLSVAFCRLCREAGTTPERSLTNDGTLQDAAAKHAISKHEFPTENVSQYLTDVYLTQVADDPAGRLEFVPRFIAR